jgi:hypothetical protein
VAARSRRSSVTAPGRRAEDFFEKAGERRATRRAYGWYLDHQVVRQTIAVESIVALAPIAVAIPQVGRHDWPALL